MNSTMMMCEFFQRNFRHHMQLQNLFSALSYKYDIVLKTKPLRQDKLNQFQHFLD